MATKLLKTILIPMIQSGSKNFPSKKCTTLSYTSQVPNLLLSHWNLKFGKDL